MRVIGLMSGTSADGVDAALVEMASSGRRCRLIAFEIFPYPKSLQRDLIALASQTLASQMLTSQMLASQTPASATLTSVMSGSVANLCRMNFLLGERFAEAAIKIAQKAGIPLSKIDLIGSHGQTVSHLPKGNGRTPSTLQIGEPSVIAERTGITTVADFRPRDMAAGGEGAPLTPYFHHYLFSDQRRSRVIVNIGGISNITYLAAGASLGKTLAFDTGPGNMLIDGLVRALTTGRRMMDRGGAIARKGESDAALLSELMRHPFIRRPPPKSTGREEFGPIMIDRILKRKEALHLSMPDIIRTATRFSASAISEQIDRFIQRKGVVDEVIVGGGGAKNPVLLSHLSEAMSPVPVTTFESLGIDGRAIEAMTFALLAVQTFRGKPNNIPSVTGARHPVILGKIIPGKRG